MDDHTNVLVVEDSEVSRMVIEKELDDDFIVYEASTSEAALESLRKREIDLILLANTLTDESSYELCESIRSEQDYGDIPIFLMGTSKDQSHYEEGFEAGASAFLTKPFEKEELSKILMHLSSRSRNQRGKSILVVDDSKSVRVVLRKSLEKVGFHVVEAENGKKALERLKDHDVDLISTDLEMPVMNGFELVQNLDDEFRNRSIPVLMLTSRQDPETRTRANDLEVDDFLTKPFQSDAYLKSIGELLNRGMDYSRYRIFFADDSDTARTRLLECLNEAGFETHEFQSGLEMLESIFEGNESEDVLPDVILLDLLMPGLDGIEVLKTLRSREKSEDIPVLMVSSYGKPSAVVEATNAGANDFISKPFDETDVLDRLQLHLPK